MIQKMFQKYQRQKVYDQNGQDITSKGTLKIDKQRSEVTFTFGENFDYKSYEDQRINLSIKAKIKNNADLSSYVDKKIPNKGNYILMIKH